LQRFELAKVGLNQLISAIEVGDAAASLPLCLLLWCSCIP